MCIDLPVEVHSNRIDMLIASFFIAWEIPGFQVSKTARFHMGLLDGLKTMVGFARQGLPAQGLTGSRIKQGNNLARE